MWETARGDHRLDLTLIRAQLNENSFRFIDVTLILLAIKYRIYVAPTVQRSTFLGHLPSENLMQWRQNKQFDDAEIDFEGRRHQCDDICSFR